jgi:preprotein translocase subunit YajC
MLLSFVLQSSTNSAFSFIFPALMLAFFYFFFIRPQIKKQKEQSAFSSELKKGDEVVTASGIIGHINKIEEQTVTLELDSKTFIKVVPSAISKEMTDQYNKAKVGKTA